MKFIIGTCPECNAIVAGSMDIGTKEEKAEFIVELIECGLDISTTEQTTVLLNACFEDCPRIKKKEISG